MQIGIGTYIGRFTGTGGKLWDISDAIIADWHMNDNAANATVTDSSGNGHDGTLDTGTTATRTTTGAIAGGTALDMNNADHIYIGDADAFSFTNETTDQPFTLATWVKLNTDASNQVIAAKRNDFLGEPDIEWMLQIYSDGTVGLRLYDDLPTSAQRLGRVTSASYDDEAFHFIVVTYDGSATEGGINIHIDGYGNDATVSDSSGTYNQMHNSDSPLILGDFYDSENDTWNYSTLVFDRTIICNRVLTEEEIGYLYNGGSGTEASSG